MVRLAVRAHDAAAIYCQHRMELFQCQILHQHIVAALQEGIVHGEHRHKPLLRHAPRHCHAVSLGDAHVEKPPGEFLGEVRQPRAVRHRRSDGAYAVILPCQLAERLAEHVGERLAALLPHLARDRVEGRHAVEPLRLPQGVGVAVALHRMDVHQHGTLRLPRLPEHRRQTLDVVAVHRPHVGKAHLLEHGAQRGKQRLFHRRLHLMAPLVQRPSRRQLFQCFAVLFLELVILRIRPHPGQVLGQSPHVPVNGHSVVVEDDHQRFAAAAGVIQALEAQTAAQRTVADDRHHVVVLRQQRPRPRHA